MKSSRRLRTVAIEAEQAVLGGLLISAQALKRIERRIREEDFFDARHRLIYRGICELVQRNTPWDTVTLAEWLDTHAQAEENISSAYILELARNTPSTANIIAYANTVR